MSSYRVVFNPAFNKYNQGVFESSEVETLQQAKIVFKAISDYTLAMHGFGLMPKYAFCGSIQKKVDGEWIENEWVGDNFVYVGDDSDE